MTPSWSMATRSAISKISGISWLTMTAVKRNFRCRSRMRWWMVLTRMGSSPVVGSSKKTISGSVTRARAMATRLRMPPEISAGFLSPISWSPIMRARSREHRPQEVVEDEDEHAGEHDGLGGGAGNALRAVAAVEALVGADPGHEHAEAERLPEADHDVRHVGVGLHLAEVRPGRHPEQDDRDQVAAADAGDVEDRREHGKGDEPRQNGGHHEIAHGVQGHDHEGVDLLGDAHDAELGGEGRARQARDEDGREHGPELSHEGDPHGGAHGSLRANAPEGEEDLEAQGHAGEAAREDDNGERLEADEVDAPGEPAELEGWDEDQGHRLAEESAEAAERRDDVEGEPHQRLDETQGQRPGRWPRSYISPRLGRSCVRQLGRPSSRKTRSRRRAPAYPEGPEGEVLRVEVILEVEDTRETRAVPERVFP